MIIKRILCLLALVFCFTSCQDPITFSGFYIKNNSSQDCSFSLDNKNYNLAAASEIIYDVKENSKFVLDVSNHQTFTQKTSYLVNETLYTLITIKDLPLYNISIYNTLNDILEITIGNDVIEVEANTTKNVSLYDNSVSSVHLKNSSYKLNYTHTISNGIIYIKVY